MTVEKAAQLGLCFGVRRAIILLRDAAKIHGKVETLGSVVHNRQVVECLEHLGVKKVGHWEEATGNVLAIPSHGLGEESIAEMHRHGFMIVDTTCPNVRRVQRAANELANGGFGVIIYGDADHPEVNAVLGWARGKGMAMQDSDIPLKSNLACGRIGILSQTTQNPEHFVSFTKKLIPAILPRVAELRIVNTICDATRKRQEAALDLVKRVDMMIVVGGYESANTQRLAEVCAATGIETHHVETATEIECHWLRSPRIGLTAGASTPDEVIEGVIDKLREQGHSFVNVS